MVQQNEVSKEGAEAARIRFANAFDLESIASLVAENAPYRFEGSASPIKETALSYFKEKVGSGDSRFSSVHVMADSSGISGVATVEALAGASGVIAVEAFQAQNGVSDKIAKEAIRHWYGNNVESFARPLQAVLVYALQKESGRHIDFRIDGRHDSLFGGENVVVLRHDFPRADIRSFAPARFPEQTISSLVSRRADFNDAHQVADIAGTLFQSTLYEADKGISYATTHWIQSLIGETPLKYSKVQVVCDSSDRIVAYAWVRSIAPGVISISEWGADPRKNVKGAGSELIRSIITDPSPDAFGANVKTVLAYTNDHAAKFLEKNFGFKGETRHAALYSGTAENAMRLNL